MRALTVLLVAGLLGRATPAGSQEPQSLLTLDEALELARRNNPAYLRARVLADATGADVDRKSVV